MADPSDAYNFGQGTWSTILANGLPNSNNMFPRACDVDSTGQYQAIGYDSAGLYISSNYGSNWSRRLTGGEFRGCAFSRNGQYMLAGNNSGLVFISSNYGSTFSTIGGLSITGNPQCTALSSNGQYMSFVGAGSQIFVSSNYGSTWNLRDTTRNQWTGNAVSDSGQWQYAVFGAIAGGGGMVRSSNYGENWASVSIANDNYQFIETSGTGQYVLSVAYSGNYYVSSNYGSNWTTFSGFGAPIFKDCWVSQSGKIMAVAARGNRIIRVSNNYGVTWSNSASPSRDWNGISASIDGKYVLAVHEPVGTSNTMVSISPLVILPPDAPTNLQVSGQNLIWTAPTQPVDLYRVFSVSSSTYTLQASTITSSIALSSLPPNTSQPYAVTASNVAGVSGYSSTSAIVNIAPNPPTGVIGDGTNLSWGIPSGGADFYKVYINDLTSYVNYLSTVSTAVPYSNLFVGSNIRYNITANGNTTGESVYSTSSPAITVSFESLPDNSVDGTTYVDALIGTGATSSNLTAQLQGNTEKFETPIIDAGVTDIRSVVNSNYLAAGFTVSSFVSSATTFLAISTSQTVTVPVENLPSSNAIFYIPANQGDAFTLSIQGKPYSIVNSGISSFTIDGRLYNLGEIFQMGGKLFKYAAVGSLILLGQGFQLAPSTPTINIRPECSDQTIYYSWLTGGVSTLSLVLEGYSTFTLPYSANSFTASGLTNGTKYSAYITNNDGNSSSAPSYFRTVEPGNKPTIVQNISGIFNQAASTISMSWTPPASNGGATVGWYVIEDRISTLKYNTYGTATGITIPFVGFSTFSIYAVNDPGYSPASNISIPTTFSM